MDPYQGGVNPGQGSGYSRVEGDGSGTGGGDPTMDFLSQAPAFGGSGSYSSGLGFTTTPVAGYTSTSVGGLTNSSSFNVVPNASSPTRVRLSNLDLNAPEAWLDMSGYQQYLHSTDDDGGIGSGSGSGDMPPPGRIPNPGGSGSLGLRPPRQRAGSSGAGRVAALAAERGEGSGSGSRRRQNRGRQAQAYDEEVLPSANVPSKLSRASWTERNTMIFCELYCNEIDRGTSKRGFMNKRGWDNMTQAYYQRTGLVHDNVTFGTKYRALKKEWGELNKLTTTQTGLGVQADGSVSASDDWWSHLSEEAKQQAGIPPYMGYLEKMFRGNAVTGETSLAATRRNLFEVTSSDDADEDEEQGTPRSTGSKRSYSSVSTRSTGTSPSKKSRSPAVRMNQNMTNLTDSLNRRSDIINNFITQKAQSKLAQQQQMQDVMNLAREAAPLLPSEVLTVAVLKIVKDDAALAVFSVTDAAGRLGIINEYSRMAGQGGAPLHGEEHEEANNWEDELEDMLFNDPDEEAAIQYGIWCCREVLLGGLGISKPYGLPRSLQEHKVPYSRLSKRRRTKR